MALKIIYRPYTAEEIAILRVWKMPLGYRIEYFAMRWVGLNLGSIVPFLIYEKIFGDVPSNTELIIVIVQQIIVLSLAIYWAHIRGVFQWNKQIENIIKNEKGMVFEITTTAIVRRGNAFGMAAGFYVQIENDKTLYIQHPLLDELHYERKFRNTAFELVRTKNGALVNCVTKGNYLIPDRELDPYNEKQYKIRNINMDGDVLHIPIEKIELTKPALAKDNENSTNKYCNSSNHGSCVPDS